MTEAPQQSNPDLDQALTNARQTISLLRAELETRKIDPANFSTRLGTVDQVLADLDAERRHNVQQRHFAKLYEVSRAIGSSLDLQTVLNQVMDSIIQLTGAERGFLMMLDDDGNLQVTVARDFDQATIDPKDFALSRTVTRQVLNTQQAIVTTNAQDDPRFANQPSIMLHGLRSIMASPLRVRDKVIGVVYVDNRIRAGLFSDQDLSVLDTFAGQAAVAIDNARLFSSTDKALHNRVEELTTLQRMDRQLNETLDTAKAIAITLEWSSRVCGAQSASMGLLDRDTHDLRVLSHYGEPDLPGGESKLSRDHPLVKQVIESQQPVLQRLDGDKPPSVFVVPVCREKQVIGVIAMTSVNENAFKEDERELVLRMADRAAIAIENARLYDALRLANNAKSEFVSVVAHELKVPMTSIQGYADLLPMVGPVNERQAQFVGTIRNAVNRMKVLVSDLNDISRIESGNLRIDLTTVSVAEAITVAAEGIAAEIEKRRHTFSLDVEPNLPAVRADKDRLTQILVNLMSNAYKYTPDGGTILVGAMQRSDGVAFRIVDSGVGMTAEQVAKLGTKFWRADNGLNQAGTGLGFAITRNLIDLMHGHLDIQSEPGKGSSFTFTLPVAGV